MSELPYKIPDQFLEAIGSGAAQLSGAIIRETSTGRILGHVQPTQAFDGMLSSATQMILGTVPREFLPLGAISVIQNQAIRGKLAEMSRTLALVQSLSVANLAVSGLGLGVSIAGFATVLKRLKGIETSIAKLEEKIDRVTTDRRQDELKRDLTDIATEVDTVATLDGRANKSGPGQVAQQQLARLAGQIERHMSDHIERAQKGRLTDADLELLWSLAAAIRLCHDTGARALFTINDLDGVSAVTALQSSRFMDLTQRLMPADSYARLAAVGVSDREQVAEIRARILPIAQQLNAGLRDTVAALFSQSTLAQDLRQKGIIGPEYLTTIAKECEEPFLFIPKSAD